MSNSTTRTSTALAPTRTSRSYDPYPIPTRPREVAPGMMDDGTLSTNHPLVQQFLAYTVRKSQLIEPAACAHTRTEAEAEVAAKRRRTSNKNKSKSKNEAKNDEKARARVDAKVAHWHGQHKHPRVTRWRCMQGGVARVEDVHAALGPGVTDRLAAAVFALAALSVYSFWTNPAHWAFWAVNIVEETAAVVHEVVRADPKVITVPDNVAWVDAKMAVRVLRVWHGGFVPPQPQPEEKEAASDEADEEDKEGETRTKKANGKRTASEDGPSTPNKRKRTKEATNLPPTRQSARIRNAAQVEPAEDLTPDTTVTSPPEEAELVADELEGMAIDGESAEPPVAVEGGSEPQVQDPPAIPSAKKTHGRPSRPRKSAGGRKPKAAPKPRVSCGDVPSEPPLPAAPSSSSALCTIRIPARSAPPSAAPVPALRELLNNVLPRPPPPQAVSGSAPPASGETTAAASRESTAVGTPLSGLSTRVGTPVEGCEVKVEPVVVKRKVVREIAAPVRTSARIRAKSLAGRR